MSVAASAHPGLVPAATAVPAPEAVTRPATMPAATPSVVPATTPGPPGGSPRSDMKTDRSAGKTAAAEMGDRHRPADGSKTTGDEPAMPPAGSDRREG